MPSIFSDQTPGFFSGSKEAYEPNTGWVYVGVGLAAVIYAIIALFDVALRPPLDPMSVQEQAAAILLCLCWIVRAHRPKAAVLLSFAVVFLDLALSHVQAQTMQIASVGAVPVLVIAAGMLFGSFGALCAAAAGGLGLPLAVYASGGWDYDLGRFSASGDGASLLVYEASVFGSAILVTAVMRSYYSVLRDTEQMRRRFEDLFSHAPDGLVSLDGKGRIVDINPAAAALFGREPAQLRGQLFPHLLDSAGARQGLDLGATDGDVPCAIELHPPGGSLRLLEISSRTMTGPESRALLVIRDGTRKRMMDELLGHAQRLESVGRLAGGVAHDFNNLLTVFQGNAEMLREHHDPEVREQARDILDAGARGALLTRQLLAFARREAHHPSDIDLGMVVLDMRRLLERVCGEQHRLVLRVDEDVRVVADVTQVEQALVNLVSNARDAMPEGGPVTIEVRSLPLDEASRLGSTLGAPSQALLMVTDSGVGMNEQVKSRLFEPFFTTKPRGKGTGLGLASVHGVIAQNKGAIWVDSAPGAGARFRIFFALGAASVRPSPASEFPAAPQGGSEHILVVEDERQVRLLCGHLLQRAGYTVSEAADGVEAMEALRGSPDVALVVSDVRMPGLSGPELAVELHRSRPDLPVLFMSGHANTEVEGHGELTSENLVRKPFTADEFLRAVRRGLKRPGQRRTEDDELASLR